MANILIRGMKMPRGCFECPFDRFGDVRDRVTSCGLKTEQGEKCPLVELPEGHGRLIDADALKKRTPMVIDYSAGGFGTDGSIRPVRGYGDWQIDQAPTIVPAEGGGEE